MIEGTHKRGDTFELSGPVSAKVLDPTTGDYVGVTDFTGWSGACQLRDSRDQIISTLTFQWLDAPSGLILIRADDDTNLWPTGTAKTDIQLTSPDGVVVSTKTAYISIVEDVTR